MFKHIDIDPYDEVLHNINYLIMLNKLLKIFKFNFINHNFAKIFNMLGLNSIILNQLLILFSLLHFFHVYKY